MSASSKCPHIDLDIHFHFNSMEDSNVHALDIKASCKICGKRLKLSRGCPMGVNSRHPTATPSTDFLGITIPVIAEDEEPDKEWGFTVTRKLVS